MHGDAVWTFGPFELRQSTRQLLSHGRPLPLGSRAFDLLCALVERAGEVLSREVLVARVWPRTIVEDSSLRVHIVALRKLLGEGRDGARYIANVPGRGYGFVAPVQLAGAVSHPASALVPVLAAAPWVAAPGLPRPLTRLVGRAETVAALSAQLARCRLVSIVGPGGVGKTALALAVAHASLASYEQGVCFLDLARVSTAAQLPAALAAALGIKLPAGDAWPGVMAHLHPRRMLIVLDNCEQLIGIAASVAERVLKQAPGVHMLTTSHEALDAEGERVHRLAPLAFPERTEHAGFAAPPDLASALAFPAIQLFVQRAMANTCSFALTDQNLVLVLQLCRQLDGMPLAIELAAARVHALGLQGLARPADELLRLLTRGRRTAAPRHQSLQAMLDWSHALLSETERVVLRRLAVFRAGFTLAAATSVVGDEQLRPGAVIEGLLGLCAKSLLAIDSRDDSFGYRLQHMTRVHAMGKLVESGERQAVAQRLAESGHERGPGRQWPPALHLVLFRA